MVYQLLTPANLQGPKAYFVDCDSIAQENFGITSLELSQKIKALCLLNEKVVVATSHVLKSYFTGFTLYEVKKLLSEGVIVPALRSECRKFGDYVDLQGKELIKALAGSEKISEEHEHRAQRILNMKTDFLEENTRNVVSWNMPETAEEFKRGLLNDLIDGRSLLHKRLGQTMTVKLVTEMEKRPILSREAIQEIACSFPTSKRRFLMNYVNIHYYLAGSQAVKSDLATEYGNITYLREKSQRSFTLDPKFRSKLPRNLQWKVFEAFMRALEMPSDDLLRLSDEQIIDIRKDRATPRFRAKFSKALTDIREGKYRETQEYVQSEEYVGTKEEFLEAINNELDKEEKFDRPLYEFRKIMKTLSYPCAVLSLLGFFFPATVPLTVTVPISAYEVLDPFIRKLWNSMGNVEFIVFGLKIGTPRRIKWRRK